MTLAKKESRVSDTSGCPAFSMWMNTQMYQQQETAIVQFTHRTMADRVCFLLDRIGNLIFINDLTTCF